MLEEKNIFELFEEEEDCKIVEFKSCDLVEEVWFEVVWKVKLEVEF